MLLSLENNSLYKKMKNSKRKIAYPDLKQNMCTTHTAATVAGKNEVRMIREITQNNLQNNSIEFLNYKLTSKNAQVPAFPATYSTRRWPYTSRVFD